ncbi:MAG TPA: TetR/AcrR family transcriptional regulator [Tahibacter sp.]|uniref:TetR/AcrR family transcriptional regulator n=1 Tax=Tahibacter sp. TaxID=2056211 RepID=UPI002BADA9AE|nr:TetR/AcrR family transcriptional regulator [Tahibacter sp.]HSX62265.1 TetR/AcrR family transcriptional regulator [Tahibacter sp.]
MPRRTDVDWIAVGLGLLVEHGHARLTVADLCARSGRTKGSLYHHYPDMAAFRAALLNTWRERHTVRLIEEAEREANVDGKVRVLDALAHGLDLPLERAIRNWAAHGAQAREVVQAVDRERIAYLMRLCREEGCSAAEARDQATLTYALFLGLQQLFGEDEQAVLRRLSLQVEFVLPRPAAAKGRRA